MMTISGAMSEIDSLICYSQDFFELCLRRFAPILKHPAISWWFQSQMTRFCDLQILIQMFQTSTPVQLSSRIPAGLHLVRLILWIFNPIIEEGHLEMMRNGWITGSVMGFPNHPHLQWCIILGAQETPLTSIYIKVNWSTINLHLN